MIIRMLVKNLAASYTPNPGGGFNAGLVHHGLAGASNVHTTVEDLAAWDNNFYDGKVGGKNVIEQNCTERFTLTDGKELSYAGGLHINKYRGLKTVEHSGSHGGFRTTLLRFPDQRFSVILLGNCSDINAAALARKVADIFLEDQLEALPTKDKTEVFAIDRAELERHCGEYLFDVGLLLLLTRKGDRLVTTTPYGRHELRAESASEFVDQADGIRFVFSETDGVRKAVLHMGTQQLEGHQLKRPLQLSHSERKEFAGDFYSDELEVFFQVVNKEGKLWLHHRKGEFLLRPTVPNEFIGDFGEYGGIITLHFGRAADHAVTGFKLSSGRVKNLKFVRAQVKDQR